jgi:hypothetical protein
LFERGKMKREEAVSLLKELSTKKLVQALSFQIEQKKTDSYQIRIWGSYDLELIQAYADLKNLVAEENENRQLIIFKP